jgi:hypothetical protein
MMNRIAAKTKISIGKLDVDQKKGIENHSDCVVRIGISPQLKPAKKARTKISNDSKRILFDWLKKHKQDPYPRADEKSRLCKETGLTLIQLNNWLINARRRYKDIK